MFRTNKLLLALGLLVLASIVLAACQPQTEIVERTVVVTEVIEVAGTPVVQVVTPTPAPVVMEPRTLVICQGQEPDTLYTYGGSMLAASHVQQAIYDGYLGPAGGIDNRSFGYQPVILEKLPSLADGDAVIQTVTVKAGDQVVGDDGEVAALEAGLKVRPSGCRAPDCAIEYDGTSDLEMDQMVSTFKLLPGLTWSDGTPLTAGDSVYSYELNGDPDTPAPSKFAFEHTASYVALDDQTTEWTGLPGFFDSTYFTNFWTPLPEHAWGQFTPAELVEAEEVARTPLGFGPYVIDEWNAGDSIRLHKNELYWRADEGLPKFDFVVYRFVGENSNANIAKILSGECDIVDQTSHLDDQSELMLELQAAGQLDATFVTGTVWEHADFGINPVSYDDGWQAGDRPDFFGDLRTRQGIVMCMDRQAVVDSVMFGQSVVLDSYLPPQHPAFNANVTTYPFDVEKGSALLEEAGWVDDDGDPATPRVYQGDSDRIPQGTLLEFNFWTTSATQRQQATQILANTMAQCGIKANLEYWNPTEYFADGPEGPLFGRRFDIGQFAWLTGVEPPCDLYLTSQIPSEDTGWSGQNDPGFSNAEYDLACNAALQSLPGEDAYTENHLLAQQIFSDQLPVAPLYLRLKLAGTRPDMCNFIMDPTANSEMFNIEEFDYGEGCP